MPYLLDRESVLFYTLNVINRPIAFSILKSGILEKNIIQRKQSRKPGVKCLQNGELSAERRA